MSGKARWPVRATLTACLEEDRGGTEMGTGVPCFFPYPECSAVTAHELLGAPLVQQADLGAPRGLFTHVGGGRKPTHLFPEQDTTVRCMHCCQLSKGNPGLRP